MASFSHQQPQFLHDSTFFTNEIMPNFHDIYSSFGNFQTQIPQIYHSINNQDNSLFSANETSCIEQQNIQNVTLTKKQSNSNCNLLKAKNVENCTPNKKKRKSKNGSPSNSANSEDEKQVKSKKKKKVNNEEETPKDYIHVRARRGQATDSHSLAERVRREKIGERMRTLQAIVPGCDMVTGKALMLDEIINYVPILAKSSGGLLSMKLATADPMVYTFGMMDFDQPALFGSNINNSGSNTPTEVFSRAGSCLASPATSYSSTLSPTIPKLDVDNNNSVSTNLVQHEPKPMFLNFQDVGSSCYGVNEQEQQSIIIDNQFGFSGNNLYTSL